MGKRGTKLILCLLVLGTVISCQRDDLAKGLELNKPDDAVRTALDNAILQTIKESGEPFDWNSANTEMLYKALMLTD